MYLNNLYNCWVAVWRIVSNDVGQINEVTLRRARLRMGDRIEVQLSVREIYLGIYNPPRSTQPGHTSVGRRNKYRPKGGDAL